MTGSARIIPADAGSTGVTMAWLTADEDHPRGCGEHAAIKTDNDGPEGSSPRMRGALSVHHHHSFLSRIIPADAGSTSTASKLIPAGGDHPRGCGEHFAARKVPTDQQRIIPADAGSTDYPHVFDD